MVRCTAISLLLLLGTAFRVGAQMPFFQTYRLLKKNEPIHVNRIFQDRNGFVWFGTDRGLFRFDGRNYHRYTVNDSLQDDQVTAIAQDSLGRIWIGHENGHLSILDDGKITAFDPPEGSATRPVSDILFDRRGRLWFSTRNDGLYYYVHNRLYRVDDMEGMPDLFVYDLLEDEEGNIWAGTDGGIVICHLDSTDVDLEVLDYEDGLPDNIVKKLVWASAGELLFATEDAGIIRYDVSTRKFSSILSDWSYGSVSDLIVTNDRMWFATRQAGLMLYQFDNARLYRFGKEPGYALADIVTLFNDREGNLWAGTKAGIVRTSGAELQFIESLGPASNRNVLAVAPDRNGSLWFSTPDGLFKRSIDIRGTVTYAQPLAHTPYGRYTVISLYCDDRGDLWAGLYGEGLLRIRQETGRVEFFSDELRNGNVLQITGRDNEIWLATLGGVERLTLDGDRVAFSNFSRASGLASDFIYQVFIDSRGRAWLGTDGRGVDVLDEGRILHYDEGLPSQVVYGFAEDSLGQVWASVQGNGLFRFSEGKFVPMETAVPLRSNDVNILTSDKRGHVVAVHDLGIDIIDPVEKSIRFRGEEYGLRDKIPTLNAVSRDREGNLYMGTADGIVRFSPERAAAQHKPCVFIDRMKVFDQLIDFSERPSLSHDENNVNITFHGFWFQNAAGLQYRYKMENYDDDWIATSDNAVTYSRLPPGDYTFRVMSADSDDFAGAPEATLHFSIAPPFWTTTPFYIAVVALLIVFAYSFVKYRERQLIDDKIILERKVEERTLEIQRKTEEIQAQNEEIMAQAEEIKGINENLEMLVNQRTQELEKKNRALEEYAFINAHKLRSPLASILGLINLILKTRLDDEGRVIGKHLQHAANELDGIVRSITKAIERGEK